MDFSQNYFELFALPVSFEVDLEQLNARYRDLQRQMHPDRYAGAGDREKRLSAQWTTQINAAYGTLKSPLNRAMYLLELHDLSIAENPDLEPMFLMEQIELREALEEIEANDGPMDKLDHFKAEVAGVLKGLSTEFSQAFDTGELNTARSAVYKMQFMTRLADAAEKVEEKILDY